MSQITLLGTGTCQLQLDKAASSMLVELDDLRFIFDMGRGITQRIAELEINQDDIEHIVFSHFHPDHISDLIPFLHAARWSRINPRTKDLHVYGPKGLQSFLDKVVDLFGSLSFDSDTYKIIVHEINSEQFSIGVHIFYSSHLPPFNNRGLKFTYKNKTYAFTGDSNLHELEIGFLKNVDLAIIDSGHISDEEIINLAAATQAKTIICYHQYRELDEVQLNHSAKNKGYTGNLIVGQDRMKFRM